MFGRVKDAVADAAETLRRAFVGLKVRDLPPEPFALRGQAGALLAAAPWAALDPLGAQLHEMGCLREAVQGRGLEPLRAELQVESGWARWGVEAEVVRMAPLEAGQAARVAVPPLPRRAQALGRIEPPEQPAVRRAQEPVPAPGTRRLDPGLGPLAVEPGLAAILRLAVPLQGEDIQKLPKGLWMRYSLQLVRGTGENVRNLEVLGLYRVPRKGVADLRHDPKLGRILVRLEPSALRADRSPFILARRKDDGALVTCFVEDP